MVHIFSISYFPTFPSIGSTLVEGMISDAENWFSSSVERTHMLLWCLSCFNFLDLCFVNFRTSHDTPLSNLPVYHAIN